MAKRRNLQDSASADPIVLIGTEGRDTIDGTAGDDEVHGLGDVDVLRGHDGDDTLIGGASRDQLRGGAGRDTLRGEEGDDKLYGGWGGDKLYGNHGDDTLDGGVGADVMIGGTGGDIYYVDDVGDIIVEVDDGDVYDIVYATASHTVGAYVEGLHLLGTDDIDGTGNDQNNNIWGNSGDNVLSGGAGNDYLYGAGGDDIFYGGAGNDHYNLTAQSSFSVIEYENEGIDSLNIHGTYTVQANIEHVFTFALEGGSVLTGNELDNELVLHYGNFLSEVHGAEGNDTIYVSQGNGYGDEGDDFVEVFGYERVYAYGGAGNDTLEGFDTCTYTGGEGADHFRFLTTSSTNPGEEMRVTDFESGVDTIEFRRWMFQDEDESITADEFYAASGAVAQTAAHRILFDTDTGRLYYDADGTGAQAMNLVAWLEGANQMTVDDLAVEEF
jgi:Ca2+-binding RTX toxin-like protein